jgi:hypothetical protein
MNKPTIFISHITEETEIARSLKELLERKFLGMINVFASSHEESIRLGDNWFGAIKKSMDDCQVLIVICSPISITRPWINFEAGAGWVKNIPVIPLCHSGLTPGKLPVPINSFQGGLLNNKNDIQKLFTRVAATLSGNSPELDDDVFFNSITTFEKEIQNTALVKDTTFIYTLLYRKIFILKYSIYASTLDHNELEKINIESDNIEKHSFTFNAIHHLYNQARLQTLIDKKVYQVFYESVNQLAEEVKFVLSYSRINITPEMRKIMDLILFHANTTNDWFDGIKKTEIKGNEGSKDVMIQMIREEPLPPTMKTSNLINYSIAYWESLNFYKSWIVRFEKEISGILNVENMKSE